MLRPSLSSLALVWLAACHTATPKVTSTPAPPGLARADSLTYSLLVAGPTYFAVLAIAPGQPIELLSPDPARSTGLLTPGRRVLSFPRPHALRSGAGQTVYVPRIVVGGGFLDELGTSGHGPISVTSDPLPASATEPRGPVSVLVLLPREFPAILLEAALPDRAGVTPTATLRELQRRLGLPEPLRWVPLAGTTRSAM